MSIVGYKSEQPYPQTTHGLCRAVADGNVFPSSLLLSQSS